jgi:hypothetical protein
MFSLVSPCVMNKVSIRYRKSRDPLPPTKCSRNQVNITRDAFSVDPAAARSVEGTQEERCLFVGYEGKICADDEQTKGATDQGYRKVCFADDFTSVSVASHRFSSVSA